jgi:hypothetical protein
MAGHEISRGVRQGVENALGVRVCGQQSIDLCPQFGIAPAGVGQEDGPLFG